MKQQTAGTLMVAVSAAGFATLAIFIKFAYAAGVNVVTLLAVRFVLASIILWPILALRKISAVKDKKTTVQLLLMGTLGYGLMSALYAMTLQYVTVSLAAILLYLYPAIVTLLAVMLGDEHFNRIKGLALLICLSGLFLVLGISFEKLSLIGIVCGIGAALVYSCYIVIGNRILKKIDPLVTTTYVTSSAGFILTVAGAAGGMLDLSFPLAGWLAIFGIVFFATIVAILCFFAGMSRIGATNAAIISTAEPVITVALSALLLNEIITFVQTIGGLLILAGVLILQVWAKSDNQSPKKDLEEIAVSVKK